MKKKKRSSVMTTRGTRGIKTISWKGEAGLKGKGKRGNCEESFQTDDPATRGGAAGKTIRIENEALIKKELRVTESKQMEGRKGGGEYR